MLLDPAEALGGERGEQVAGDVVEAEAADERRAGIGGDRSPAVEGVVDERLLAGRVEVVGAGPRGGLDHGRAVQGERARAGDHDPNRAEQLAQAGGVVDRDRGDACLGVRTEAGGDRLELRLVAAGEDHRHAAAKPARRRSACPCSRSLHRSRSRLWRPGRSSSSGPILGTTAATEPPGAGAFG